MRTHHSRRDTPDRIDPAFAGADANAPAPRSASIHLLNPATTSRKPRSVARSTQRQPGLRNEAAEVLTDVDGLPILVRFLVKDMPAEMRSASKASDIHALLSSTLEKMVGRIGGLSPRNDAPARQPLAIVELISSGDSLLRQEPAVNETVLRVGSLALDLMDRTAKRGDRRIDLRPREFQLLKYMMQRSDKLLTRATLFREVWNYKFVPDSNLVDVHMGRLRRKVDGPNEAPMIRNVRGAGFVLSATPLSEGRPGGLVKNATNLAVADKSTRPVQGGLQ
ncbi:MAG: two-component system, OmpR family, response regulator [Bradyrhizobium sp.]|nr:two-component system, OmpR family, response regulator [Bradyrhizobium sp.]